MRIIAGSKKGARIFAPKGRDTRPTADRVREAAFNLLGPGAAEDATVHQIMSEVSHLVKPSGALCAPEIVSRVSALMDASI